MVFYWKNRLCTEQKSKDSLKSKKELQLSGKKKNLKGNCYLLDPTPETKSNRVQNNSDSNWAFDLSVSSKMQLFHSIHNHYITHNRLRFQIYDKCFPNQFLLPNKRFVTLLGNHAIPKVRKTMLHKTYATSQWINKWSILSITLIQATTTS